jgi:hypothetical protein
MRLLWPIPPPIPKKNDERRALKIPNEGKIPANWPSGPIES